VNLIETWLNNVAYSHSQSKNTEISYKQGLNKFLNFIGKTPEQILEEYENTTDREFKRKYAKLVRDFISLQIKDFAVGSIGTFVSAVRSFFMYNDLPLGHVPIAKGMVVYHNRDITKEEIKLLLGISRPRDKAFFCLMAQTGLRPYTICKLELKHIEPEFSKKTIPCKIDVPQEIAKGKYGAYFTFMGEDSIRYLNNYLHKRKHIKPDDYLFTKHGSNKPITPNALSVCFKALVNKLRITGNMNFERTAGKPAEVRLYNLRRYFRKFAGIMADDKHVQFWMGHSLGVDDHYFSRDVELHRKVYAEKAMPYLLLGRATQTETENEIKTLTAEVEKLRNELRITQLVTDKSIEEWRNEMEELRSELNMYRDQDLQDQDREMREEYARDPDAFRKKYDMRPLTPEERRKKQEEAIRQQPWLKDYFEKTKKRRAGKKPSKRLRKYRESADKTVKGES